MHKATFEMVHCHVRSRGECRTPERCGLCILRPDHGKHEGVVYRGMLRETPCLVTVTQVTPEIGQIDCIECGGTGRWDFGPTAAECGPCVECKGTGKVYVS